MLTRPLTRGFTRPLVRGFVRGGGPVVVITISGDAYAGSTLTIDGGSGPYEYVIDGVPSGVFSSSPLPASLLAGSDVQVRDANGVLSNTLISIAPVTISGQAYAGSTITVSGGIAPYEYVIDGVSTGVATSSPLPDDLEEGSLVRVKDVNGVLSNTLTALDQLT